VCMCVCARKFNKDQNSSSSKSKESLEVLFSTFRQEDQQMSPPDIQGNKGDRFHSHRSSSNSSSGCIGHSKRKAERTRTARRENSDTLSLTHFPFRSGEFHIINLILFFLADHKSPHSPHACTLAENKHAHPPTHTHTHTRLHVPFLSL